MSALPSGPAHVYSGGFLGGSAQARTIRRIMTLAGLPVRLGWPGAQGRVAVWGHSPRARRGAWVAERSGAKILRLEDAFLRSVFPGRVAGEAPLGLLIDERGVHYDPTQPSDLETLLATHPFDDHALIERARLGIARLRAAQLSKYCGHDPDMPPPPPGYVLLIDQVRGDASLRHGGLSGEIPAQLFQEMLIQAQLDHPGARIVIKAHPESRHGARAGHFDATDITEGVSFSEDPVSPWELLEGAIAVYTVSSQMGFEAILAGHRPHVFGHPFYAGWGLTQDLEPHPRRGRRLTRAQLFAGAMLLYPHWYDPCRDALCSYEQAFDHLEAQVRAWREDRHGYVAHHMRAWKRPHLQGFFGRWKRLRFAPNPAPDRPSLIWGAAPAPAGARVLRVEDGFLRSRGLGAALTPPLSLVADDLGLYYDPTRPSRLEALIAAPLPPGGAARARRLIAGIRTAGLSKYNMAGTTLVLPAGHRILVPGQVEDDASITLGAGSIRTNLALLAETRARNPGAVVIYKPHPDVEAGLRPGAVAPDAALRHADLIADRADPVALLDQVQEVWTMTSTLGFEALLREIDVTTFGAPFYAGWGLTRDLGPVPARRTARPGLEGFVHAALIAYPRYLDPVTGLPCPVEVAIDRLAAGVSPRPPLLRVLAKAQGVVAPHMPFWR